MTNPNDAVGTNAAFDGRTSVKAFNDIAGCFSSAGILSGWECAPDSGMYVVLGGNGTTRDVALAENNTGDKTTINNRSGQPIQLEIAAAPATDSRIDAIVAYVTTPPTGVSTVADNPSTVGLIDVVGVEDPSPVAPDDNAIRTAISADGGSGATAYYVILAYVTVANGTTDITNNMISAGASATLNSTHIADGSITSDKVDFTAYSASEQVVGTWIDGSTIYRQVVYFTGNTTANQRLLINLTDIPAVKRIVAVNGCLISGQSNLTVPIGIPWIGGNGVTSYNVVSSVVADNNGNMVLHIVSIYSNSVYGWVILDYTKR